MAGPLRPRWVKSRASSKPRLPTEIRVGSTAMPAQLRHPFEDARLEGERDEGRAGWRDGEAELGGELIGEAGGAHLGDRLRRRWQRPGRRR